MSPQLDPRDASSEPAFADLMRDLAWTPGYRDADSWFAPAVAESIVIHEAARWPGPFDGFGFGESTAAANGLAGQAPPPWMVRDLLDAHNGRLVRGYLAVGRSLQGAHVLSCALAADAGPRIESCASAADPATMAGAKNLRAVTQRFWREAASCGPFEFLVVVGFLFETLLVEWFAQWPADSRAAWNPQRAKLGREVLCFLLDQDPSNLPPVQDWLDRGTAGCAQLFDCADKVLRTATTGSAREVAINRREPFAVLTEALSGLVSHGIRAPAIPVRRGPRSRAHS